ncbi:hypothetical protein JMJ77_0002330 [Colletotrichum scovillei]|uniref:Transmembrane protein n=2 Tax=Colletotrichum scovillei TaxID=1209932 RepID=A0A9P7R9E3_9PEZI|nr:hypothetical protein JMJ77_0002330 [Colletotrichum scovillei]KAG7070750.1 hypothetical protein JMJ76_0001996 [Colletotrichum scovillei]KAG7078986.1 hypothetical protein JMJ78_0002648 [Colletotrichum scovillei]
MNKSNPPISSNADAALLCAAGKVASLAAEKSQLWHQYQRIPLLTITMNVILLSVSALRLFNISWTNIGKKEKVTRQARRMLWALERLLVIDLAVSISKACSILWIARQKCDVPKTYYNAYEYLESIDGFFLSLAHAGVLLLVGELGILFWGQPGERQQVRNFWFIVNQSSHALGWIMALGVVGIQISISVMKQYYVLGLPGAEDVRLVSQDLATDGMIKILLFFVGLLLCLPFQSVGGSWLWGNLLLTTATWTWRLARVFEKKGLDEITPHVNALIVDIFYSRMPTIFLLAMFTFFLRPSR